MAALLAFPIQPQMQLQTSHREYFSTNYNPAQALGFTGQVHVLIRKVNHKGNLKDGLSYLQ